MRPWRRQAAGGGRAAGGRRAASLTRPRGKSVSVTRLPITLEIIVPRLHKLATLLPRHLGGFKYVLKWNKYNANAGFTVAVIQ